MLKEVEWLISRPSSFTQEEINPLPLGYHIGWMACWTGLEAARWMTFNITAKSTYFTLKRRFFMEI
jgi:hypothetical protein